MMRFEFVARDRSGEEKRGTIEAGSRENAVAELHSRELQPLSITPVAASSREAGVPPPLCKQDGGNTRRGPAVGFLAPNFVAIAMSSAALVFSLAALFLSLWHDPLDSLGPGLEQDDFSTPEAASTSIVEMQRDRAVRANIEVTALAAESEIEQKLKTRKIRKKVADDARTILFVSYQIEGKEKHECEAFERHADTGYWLPTYVSSYGMEQEDPGLARQMREWEEEGH